MAYWNALKTINDFQIIEGRLKKRKTTGKYLAPVGKGIKKGEIVDIEKYEEKESDVNMASHILFDCIKSKVDCIVLLSNDTDLLTPLSMARKEFGKKIGIISPARYTHEDLKAISHFDITITDKNLKESQFPKKVGTAMKPSGW